MYVVVVVVVGIESDPFLLWFWIVLVGENRRIVFGFLSKKRAVAHFLNVRRLPRTGIHPFFSKKITRTFKSD